jgi:hypothetical protein
VGTEAILQAEPAYDYKASMQWAVRRGSREEKQTFPKADQFAAEMDYFSACILENRDPEPSGTEGLADVRVIQAINEALKTGRAVKLKSFKKSARPSLTLGKRLGHQRPKSLRDSSESLLLTNKYSASLARRLRRARCEIS